MALRAADLRPSSGALTARPTPRVHQDVKCAAVEPAVKHPADAAGLHPALGSARAQRVSQSWPIQSSQSPRETTVSATSPGTLTQLTGLSPHRVIGQIEEPKFGCFLMCRIFLLNL